MAIDSGDLVGGGLPKLAVITPVLPSGSRIKSGDSLGSKNSGTGLSTVVDITVPGVISYLVIGSENLGETIPIDTITKVKITLDGNVVHDNSIVIGASVSAFYIGSYATGNSGTDDTSGSIVPFRTSYDTLKVEIDNTASTRDITLFGDPRTIA